MAKLRYKIPGSRKPALLNVTRSGNGELRSEELIEKIRIAAFSKYKDRGESRKGKLPKYKTSSGSGIYYRPQE